MKNKSRFRFLKWGLLGFVAIIILAVIIVPRVVDINSFKPKIYKIVKEQTGRDLVINGPIKLNIFPWVKVSLTDVEFANAAGFSPANMATVSEVNVSIKVIPLLKKEIEVGKVLIDGLELYYTVNEDNVSNIQDILDLQAAASKDKPDVEQKVEDSSAPFNLQTATISSLVIKNSLVSYEDKGANQTFVLKPTVEIGKLGLNRPVDISVIANAVGTNPNINADIDMKSKLALNDFKELVVDALVGKFGVVYDDISAKGDVDSVANVKLEDLFVDVSKLKLNANVLMKDITADIVLDTAISTDMKIVNIPAMKGKLNTKIGDINAVLDFDSEVKIALEKLLINLNNLKLAGNISMPDINADINLNTSVSTDTKVVHVDTVKGKINAKVKDMTAVADIDSVLDVNLDGGLVINVAKLAVAGDIDVPDFGKQKLSLNSVANYNADKNSASLSNMKLDLLGISASGNVNLTQLDKEPVIMGTVALAQFSLRDLMKMLKMDDLLATKDPNSYTKVSGTLTNFKFADNKLTVPAKIKLDSSNIDTNAYIDLSGKKLYVKLPITIDKINADNYIPQSAEPEVAKKPDVKAASGAKKDLVIEMPNLDLVSLPNVDVDAKIGALTVMDIKANNVIVDAKLKDGVISAKTVSVDVYNGNVKVSATVVGVKDKFSADAISTVSRVSLPALLKDFAPDVDTKQLPKVLNAYIDLSANNEAVNLKKGDIKLDDLTVDLIMSAKIKGRPHIMLSGKIGDVDMNKYASKEKAPKQSPADKGETGESGESFLHNELPLADITNLGMDVDAALSIKSFKVDNIQTGAVSIVATAKNGELLLTPKVNLYDGLLDASFGVKEQSANNFFTAGSAKLARLNVEKLLTGLNPKKKARLAGILNMDLNLGGNGTTLYKILDSSNGNIKYALDNGKLRGIGYDPNSINLLSSSSFNLLGASKETPLSNFQGGAKVTKGEVSLERVHLKSSYIEGDVGGTVGIVTEKLDLTGNIRLSELTLPYTITGKYTAPKLGLNQKDIGKQLLQNLIKPGGQSSSGSADSPSSSGGTNLEKKEEDIKESVREGLKEGLKGIFK